MTKKINALDAFLASNTEVTEDVIIPRLNTQITVKTLSPDAFKSASADSIDKKGNVDATAMFTAFIAESETSGLFRTAELMEKTGANSPQDCVAKTLLIGEIVALGKIIQDLSGFDADAQITKAKN